MSHTCSNYDGIQLRKQSRNASQWYTVQQCKSMVYSRGMQVNGIQLRNASQWYYTVEECKSMVYSRGMQINGSQSRNTDQWYNTVEECKTIVYSGGMQVNILQSMVYSPGM